MTRAHRDREVYPHVQERIGEDPARFLDRDLDGDALDFVESRIQGIDRFEVLAGWGDVERNLVRTPDGSHNEAGRDQVIELLQNRACELEEHGDRDEKLQRRRDIREAEDDVDVDEPVIWRHTKDGCDSINVEQESNIAWFCHACEQRTNRVERVDPDDVSLDELPDAHVALARADGGREEGSA